MDGYRQKNPIDLEPGSSKWLVKIEVEMEAESGWYDFFWLTIYSNLAGW